VGKVRDLAAKIGSLAKSFTTSAVNETIKEKGFLPEAFSYYQF
jgi:hypothetical protein